MYSEIIDGSRYWDVYGFDENGDAWGPITYCHQDDITYCAGNWKIYVPTLTWIYDPSATSLYDDCTYTECDFSDYDDTEMRCYVRMHSFSIFHPLTQCDLANVLIDCILPSSYLFSASILRASICH